MYPANQDAARPADPGRFLASAAEPSEGFPGGRSVEFPVCVVLPAGGCGERTGLTTPKQFCSFLNRPLISYTIQAFERIAWIERVVVAVAGDSRDLMRSILSRFGHQKVEVVVGGLTRHRSIFNGLQALSEGRKPKVVIIHDAVRPFVEEQLIRKIALAAEEHGAAGAMRPLVSTVIATTAEGYLDHSLERAKYRASEMPQAFQFDIIHQAYQRCSDFDLDFGTECLHLALQYCHTNAKLIEGPPTLWKVTYKHDLFAAEALIKDTLSQSALLSVSGGGESTRLAAALHKSLEASSTVDVVSGLLEDDRKQVANHWNFIHIAVDPSCVTHLTELIRVLKESNQAVWYPVVVILVHLNMSTHSCVGRAMEDLGAVRGLAAEANQHNVLLYGVLLQLPQVPDQWKEAVESTSRIIQTLIRERSPALSGQLMVV